VNAYDDFRPDVAALLRGQDSTLPRPADDARSGDGLGAAGRALSVLRLYALGLAVKTGVHRRLVYANLRLDWFHEFQRYWVGELGNRPIHPHDFYHLYGVYRQRLQTIDFEHLSNPALASDEKHLTSWRDHRLTYYLFAHTYRQALSPLHVQRYARYIHRRDRVAEYGCGAAPMLTALARRYRHLDLQLVGADLPHLLFHFARWRFRDLPYVRMVPIQPDNDAPLPGQYDAIFCMEVFEHVPRPLAVAEHLHRALRPGGRLIFDYVRSEGTGLDTASSLRDRIPTLEFLLQRFEILQGQVPTDGAHVQPAVLRKRS
jgi:2-polyprenyl-3-methyl-5-hydroxy-6-metoxy-1,4-benzoquinol methylase